MALLCSVSCAPTWPCVDRNRHDRVRGAAYDGGLGRRAVRPGWLGVRGEQCGARLGGLLAVAALGFAFGGTSASDIASVAVVEAYRRVMWTAAALTVRAALMALTWLGNEPPERRRAN